ncbi:MAG: YIP1 family protein [Clostridia bacterium]|nr:YIP1 family protein [Clostridia bacterium]
MKKFISVLALLFALLIMFSVPVSAASAYQTYTYSIHGSSINSPAAYTPVMEIDSGYMGLEKLIDDPRDMVVDKDLNVYIADAKNNRIVCLDRYYKVKFTIDTFTNEYGVPDELTAPSGVFVTNDRIFVCDTDANRIVTFDKDGEYLAIIPEPESELFDEGSVYKPVAIAVDQYDRLYVVSSTTYQGIIVMTDEGEFTGFIGAQKVTISAWDIIWRRFQTEAQKELSTAYVSTEFNNISINDEGFIYVTTSSIDKGKQQSAIRSKSKSGDFAPVKMLNANGDEIMRRNGFYPPSGEVDVSTSMTDGSITGPSKIIDVAVGPEKTWSIIDEARNKIFTYDFDGNLLWAFGDSGTQLGNLSSIEAIAYQGDTLLILDKTNDNITVYKRTEYGDVVISALANENNRNYDRAIDDWMEILKRNSNFDTAYIGIGESLYRSGDYQESLEYFKAAYDTAGYSTSYQEIRKEWISKWILTIPVGVILIVLVFSKFSKYAAKVNKRAATAGGKRTFKEELLYGFHVILHPFDGFWDLKHEKRGSLRAALVFILIAILTFFYEAIGSGYVINPFGTYTTVWAQAISVLVPFALFAVANWCLTTLFEGEGSFKDIVIALSYALIPLPLLIIPSTILSNVVTASEVKLLSLLGSFAFIWVGILIFFGTQVTHDYSLGKNMLTVVGTLVGMVFIMFIGILFTTLLGKIVSLISNIVIEITYRL